MQIIKVYRFARNRGQLSQWLLTKMIISLMVKLLDLKMFVVRVKCESKSMKMISSRSATLNGRYLAHIRWDVWL